jgi:hypothetical protein
MIKKIIIVCIVGILASQVLALYEFRGPLKNIRPQDWTASRLAYITSANDVNSVLDLTVWVAGTPNQVYITDDGDGSATWNLPQDINTISWPTFADMNITSLDPNSLVVSNTQDRLVSLATGPDGYVLEANSAETLGMAWEDPNTGIFSGLYLAIDGSNADQDVNISSSYDFYARTFNDVYIQTIATGNYSFGSSTTMGSITNGTNNTFMGSLSGPSVTSGSNNTGVGRSSMLLLETPSSCTAIGLDSMYGKSGSALAPSSVVAIGPSAAKNIGNCDNSVFIGEDCGLGNSAGSDGITGRRLFGAGYRCLYNVVDACDTVAIGNWAGYSLTNGDSDVFIGQYAGYNQTTNDNLLIIDNQDRGSAANEITNALIYGVFNATPASQSLRINGELLGDDGAKLGDVDANYVQVAPVTGQLTLVANARVVDDVWVDAGALRAPGAKPASRISHGVLETPAWQFGDELVANRESISASMKLKNSMDRSVGPTLCVGWSTTTIYTNDSTDNETIEWQVAYLYTQEGESTAAAAEDTKTVSYTLTAATAAEGLVSTSFATLDAPHASDVCLHLKLTRLSNGAGPAGTDTISDDVELHGIVLLCTTNKLGTPL